ncbi:Aste57867_13321 [Aphanomyces stellatus]|uniref:Aste57867_13321 protein n=1 Tax=Aphanomyces stellatus TaxID=120398 RepID=A0A485KXT7_9STRA|nr:hypothetical protein As57867_013272 [Aphanomyces stellatus]VFT90160.1 Aste57867_13321 [Aphanomyces stellatus]
MQRKHFVCCASLSIAGVVFLSLLGALLFIQPQYVRGLDRSIPRRRLALNCWLAAAAYAATWFVSTVGLCIHARCRVRARRNSAYELKGLRRTLASWEDLGMPSRMEKQNSIVFSDDEDESVNGTAKEVTAA